MSTKIVSQTGCEPILKDKKPLQVQAVPKLPKVVTCGVLRQEEYQEWDELIDRSPHGTIFHYSWWLRTTSADFSILAIRNERGAIVAGMPIPFEHRPGLKLFRSPILTPYLGPVFDVSNIDNTCDRLHFMRSNGELLARNIKAYDSVQYVAGASAPDLQGFVWAGFGVRLAYTFRFRSTHTPDQITAGMTQTHREKLTTALQLKLSVARDGGLDDLIQLNRRTLAKHGSEPACSESFLRRLWKAAHSQERAHLYVARTADDKPLAALLTVNDNRTTYQIVSAVDPDFANIPGAYIVLWNALQDALVAGRDYDFEVSSLRGAESFCRHWGATAVPVWRMEKAGSWRGGVFHSLINRRDSKALRK
ncbi:MAG TPA: GNAT family N-acetyltransferase [Candidatus Acidoferrales bacterium]|nr:GNAT family N-acetyltransferase [Candidatus Acidoferrales bacterium]